MITAIIERKQCPECGCKADHVLAYVHSCELGTQYHLCSCCNVSFREVTVIGITEKDFNCISTTTGIQMLSN